MQEKLVEASRKLSQIRQPGARDDSNCDDASRQMLRASRNCLIFLLYFFPVWCIDAICDATQG